MSDTNNILSLRGISHQYSVGGRQIEVLSDVDLDVADGEIVEIQGQSGSGKTTLLLAGGGMQKPTAGQVSVGGQDLFRIPVPPFREQHLDEVLMSKCPAQLQHKASPIQNKQDWKPNPTVGFFGYPIKKSCWFVCSNSNARTTSFLQQLFFFQLITPVGKIAQYWIMTGY